MSTMSISKLKADEEPALVIDADTYAPDCIVTLPAGDVARLAFRAYQAGHEAGAKAGAAQAAKAGYDLGWHDGKTLVIPGRTVQTVLRDAAGRVAATVTEGTPR